MTRRALRPSATARAARPSRTLRTAVGAAPWPARPPLTLRTVVGAVALTLLVGCSSEGHGSGYRDPAVPAGALSLVAFTSCADVLDGLRTAAKAAVGPWGFPGSQLYAAKGQASDLGGPAGAAPNAAEGGDRAASKADDGSYSGTNTHEAGVDEPDLVKTDGRRIVTISNTGVLRVVDAAGKKITGSLDLVHNDQTIPVYGTSDLLLSGDHAMVLANSYQPVMYDGKTAADSGADSGGADSAAGGGVDSAREVPTPLEQPINGPRLLLVNLTGTPKIMGEYRFDGALVDARQVGSVARVVVKSVPRVRFPAKPAAGNAEQRTAANRAAIDSTPVEDWLPRYSVANNGRASTGRVGCTRVSRPADYSGSSMLSVLTFDLAKSTLGNGDPVSVVADGETVYANGPSLYVANDQRWRVTPQPAVRQDATGSVVPPKRVEPRTDLYRFDISGSGRPSFQAGGSVPGWLLNQYSMSEWKGHFRVATTTGVAWDTTTRSESGVYVLKQDGRRLVETGHVGGLGKGERIYAVRFTAGTGYVVTFRQMDPLYVVDLRDAAKPKVTGELKITGYSAYLHPVGDTRLIGIGQEATEQGRRQGTQVSLFDVGNPAAPRRLAQYQVKMGQSEAEFDPHAFLYWAKTSTLVVPITLATATPTAGKPGTRADSSTPTQGAVVLSLGDASITERGMITHEGRGGAEYIRRSLVIGNTLWTLSESGLKASDLSSLNPTAWIPFT